MFTIIEVTGEETFFNEEPTPICPETGTYCTGSFCDEYGCAKEAGFYDGEFEVVEHL